MAIKEARCTNCGSIMMLNPGEPTSKCLFCRAVVDTQEALAVASDPTGYVFPNEPQPDEDTVTNAASLYNKALKQSQGGKPSQGQGATKTAQAKKAPPRTTPVEIAPRAQVEKIEMPSAKLSNSAKIKIALTVAVLFLVTAAAVLPVTIIRDKNRTDLSAKIDNILPFDYIGESAYAISKTGNTSFSVVATEKVDAAVALAVFRDFCEARAEVYGLDPAADSFSRVYGRVTVKVISPESAYEVSKLESEADLKDTGKVRVLG